MSCPTLRGRDGGQVLAFPYACQKDSVYPRIHGKDRCCVRANTWTIPETSCENRLSTDWRHVWLVDDCGQLVMASRGTQVRKHETTSSEFCHTPALTSQPHTERCSDVKSGMAPGDNHARLRIEWTAQAASQALAPSSARRAWSGNGHPWH